MNTPMSAQVVWRIRAVSLFSASVALLIGCVALAGWITGYGRLTSFSPALAATSVPTATALVFSALALWAHAFSGTRRPLRWIGDVLAVVVLVGGCYALLGYLRMQGDAGYVAGPGLGRVSVSTAVGFVLVSLAILVEEYGRHRVSATLATLGLLIAAIALTGYAYDVQSLYRVPVFADLALPTAVGLAALCMAQILAYPQHGWIKYAFRDDRIGTTYRIILPAVVVVPFALAFIVNLITRRELMDPSIGFAIVAVATTVILSLAVGGVTAWFARTDAALKQAQDELLENAQLLESAMAVAEIGAWVAAVAGPEDDNGRLELSSEAHRIFGLDKRGFRGDFKTFLDGINEHDRPRVVATFREALAGELPADVTYRFRRADEAERWIRQQVRLLHDKDEKTARLVGVVHDVTESRLIEKRLVQAQKMEAIGNLTGGMAHDFNNLLAIIIGNLELLPEDVLEREDASVLIENSLDAALRGADLTRRLLAFASRQPLQPQSVSPNDLVNGIVELLKRTLGESIQIGLELDRQVGPILVDPAQFEASITNLANNARDAMPKGGRLVITTSNRYVDADHIAGRFEVSEGDYVVLEVSDTGIGMTPEVMANVFDPFFTTKEPGKGTGLGLSMVFGFMKQSGGYVDVYSEPDAGTTFRLYFPRDLGEAQAAVRQVAEEGAGNGGTETVLVVEDNDAIRQVVVRQLSEFGYRVVEAVDAASALELLQSAKVDLLFTDVVMPGEFDGKDLAKAVLARFPTVKVLLTSGFPQARLNGDSRIIEGVRLLPKPYRRTELAQALREVLDS